MTTNRELYELGWLCAESDGQVDLKLAGCDCADCQNDRASFQKGMDDFKAGVPMEEPAVSQ